MKQETHVRRNEGKKRKTSCALENGGGKKRSVRWKEAEPVEPEESDCKEGKSGSQSKWKGKWTCGNATKRNRQ